MLQRLADQIIDDKIMLLRNRIGEIDTEKRLEKKSQNKADIGINTLEKPNQKLKNEILTPREIERKQCEQEAYFLRRKPQKEKLLEFYAFLQCDDKEKYRTKLKGIKLPYDLHEKTFKIPFDEQEHKNHFIPTGEKSAEEIKREVEYLKKSRLEKKKMQELEEKERYERNRKTLKKVYEQQMRRRMEAMESIKYKQQERQKEVTYKELKNKQLGMPVKAQQFTWQMLKTLTFKDVFGNMNENDNFSPLDLIIEKDKEEDQEIMRKLVPLLKGSARVPSDQEQEGEKEKQDGTQKIKFIGFGDGRKSVPPNQKNNVGGRNTQDVSPLRQSSNIVPKYFCFSYIKLKVI